MKEKAQARLDALQADVKSAKERLETLQTEAQQVVQYLQAASGAMEVLRELLGVEEGPVLG